MPAAPLPANEAQRLERLRRYEILDTAPEDAFDRIVRLAAAILDVPIAVISLVDEGRQWFKAKVGIDAPQTDRDVAFCAHAILGTDVLVVPDATKNPTFSDNPLVTSGPAIRFYAGAPLMTQDGFNLGTVCGIDSKPRTPTPAQVKLLQDLGALVIDQLELRAAGKHALAEVDERIRIDSVKSAFISTVNHELRTPLTSIIGALELINSGAAGEVSDEVNQLLSIADRNSTVLLRLINDLLDSAKIAEGTLKLDMSTMDLNTLVAESIENVAHYCSAQAVTVSFAKGPSAPVRVDRVRMAQVMNNLLSNAVKFSPKGGDVRIGVTLHANRAEVSITDKAGGIPDSIRERMFQKFVQADRGAVGRPGTGLGLNIAKAIVEQHGGEIGFETETGVGTRFFFRLPLSPA